MADNKQMAVTATLLAKLERTKIRQAAALQQTNEQIAELESILDEVRKTQNKK